MFLDQYYNQADNKIQFTRDQASKFAKDVADDFNPIHDVDAKKFCVPGDLLFSLTLGKGGLSQHMFFEFSGMIGDNVELLVTDFSAEKLVVVDSKEKEYLTVSRTGEQSDNITAIESLVKGYVEFSGHNFPHVLVPLMQEKNVMINPARPLVIYESMTIDLDTVNVSHPKLEFSHSTLNVDGKRGNVTLGFVIKDADTVIGKGEKKMVLSGLREYDQSAIDDLVELYNDRKAAYKG